jgi:hypothetical protein
MPKISSPGDRLKCFAEKGAWRDFDEEVKIIDDLYVALVDLVESIRYLTLSSRNDTAMARVRANDAIAKACARSKEFINGK